MSLEVIRYDVLQTGKPNPDYDTVCPVCLSSVGFPCTEQGVYGMIHRKEIHTERKESK